MTHTYYFEKYKSYQYDSEDCIFLISEKVLKCRRCVMTHHGFY